MIPQAEHPDPPAMNVIPAAVRIIPPIRKPNIPVIPEILILPIESPEKMAKNNPLAATVVNKEIKTDHPPRKTDHPPKKKAEIPEAVLSAKIPADRTHPETGTPPAAAPDLPHEIPAETEKEKDRIKEKSERSEWK